jgi:putative flippase GtrA
MLSEFGRFVGVGLVVTAAHYVVLVALVEAFGWGPVHATMVGAFVGAVLSYGLNRRFTFTSDRSHREAGWRFAIVAGTAFVLNAGLMALFVDGLALPYLPSQIAATGVVVLWTFGLNKAWTFSR